MADANCSGRLLRDSAVVLAENDLRLCVLHGHENYPLNIESDLDCVGSEPRQIPRILSSHGVDVVQAIEMGPEAFYYVLYRPCGTGFAFTALDVAADYRRNGRVFFSRDELERSCRSIGEINIPATEVEFTAYLVKKILKKSLEPQHANRLSELYQADPVGCRRQLSRFLPAEEAQLIAEAASSAEWGAVMRKVATLRGLLLDGRRGRNLFANIRDRVKNGRRIVGRLFRPTGLCVAVLGPEGSGKSSLINRVGTDLAPMFWRVETSPWATRRRERRAYQPGSRRLATLSRWFAGYPLGYAFAIYPKLVRSTFVLLEGYDHLIAHPERYAGRTGWVFRSIDRLGGRPDLIIVLDAPPEALLARRPDVPLAELARQRVGYLKTARRLTNSHVVDASRAVGEVTLEVERLIIGHMLARVARRFGIRLHDGDSPPTTTTTTMPT